MNRKKAIQIAIRAVIYQREEFNIELNPKWERLARKIDNKIGGFNNYDHDEVLKELMNELEGEGKE